MVEIISIILSFLIIYILFKIKHNHQKYSGKIKIFVYIFLILLFLLGLVSVVLGIFSLLTSYTMKGNWSVNISSVLIILSGALLIILSYIGFSNLKKNVRRIK